MKWTYSKAGVDLSKHHSMHSIAQDAIRRIEESLGVKLIEGNFTRLITLNGVELTMHTDGVGTKSIIAWEARKLRVLGWDCVVSNINDVACDGVTPMAVVDYIAISSNDTEAVGEVIKGVTDASLESNIVLLGGETAIMPDLINGIDVSCTVLGIKSGGRLMRVNAGDLIIGVESNGLHMNGYTLARRVLLSRFKLSDEVCSVQLANELLKPTLNYSKLLLRLYNDNLIKAAVNVTGGGFTKVRRVIGEMGVEFNAPEPPCIFRVIKETGNVEWSEMYRVFNMGVGLMLIVNEEKASRVENTIDEFGLRHWVMGSVNNSGRLTVNLGNVNFNL
ncbi:phosphoribosylformylglycinamidine cyclo-ligase [Caldivirga maquilingensis]|uniref:phosphoribosylformylglycinamidine cyclo-ligase n=1 Tax=Caldivirga maquilingensis (strain ATCC 700844 / DSM 13496 / JCM 10307 / IC-167) TaxID=397948 RepID=A8MCJ9_CALMQ|nr:phosphoribosylformylglycinamidine cyclo-ligase [Caldivirga maquilingensis]ABW01505.1 phosphoribosylformylglycinamidine cyclo-ligase [Caldivirga maquilingensis IC-167]